MKTTYRWVLLLATCQVGATAAIAGQQRPATRNVVLVTADGVRWQEVFRGAEEALLNQENGGVTDVDSLRRDFWRETREARLGLTAVFEVNRVPLSHKSRRPRRNTLQNSAVSKKIGALQ